jgi:hypothetical protein
MNALARIDIGRLAKFCGMLGSAHDGERAAAALKADGMVRAAGLTWLDVLRVEVPGASKSQSHRRRAVMTPGELLARYGNELTGWERGFIASLIRRPGRWTARQTEVFAEIRDRVAGGAV